MNRLLLNFIKTYRPNDLSWVNITNNIINIDKFCDRETVFLPLVNYYFDHYKEKVKKEYSQSLPVEKSSLHYIKLILKLLIERLDFETDSPKIWKILAETLFIINEKYIGIDQEFWKNRRDWWKSFHFENKTIDIKNINGSEKFFVYRAICSVYIYGKNKDLKSNYIYNIPSSLKKVILKHGFTETEIYPECSEQEIKAHVSSLSSSSSSHHQHQHSIKDTINKNQGKEDLKDLKIILGKSVPACLINYVIRKDIAKQKIINEKVKSFLERVATEFNCLNKVYLPDYLKNQEYQKDIFEIRDLLLTKLPKLKAFYRNYRNMNVFYILKYYGISTFHIEFLKFEKDHPYEVVYFEELQKRLMELDDDQLDELKPSIDYVYQNNDQGFLGGGEEEEEKEEATEKEKRKEKKGKKKIEGKKNKLFIINQLEQTIKEKMNAIDEEIVDNYEELNPTLIDINTNFELERLKELISKCHQICVKHSIPSYLIKYIFGIQFLTF